MYYHKPYISKYLDSLECEIKKNYRGEELRSLYIGGGTPTSLDLPELERLFEILSILKLSSDCEFTIEANVENLDEDKLKLFYSKRVNRLSIGIQTFNEKFIKYLGRNHTKDDAFRIVNLAKEIGFTNINVDLMYAIKDQTLDNLESDIDLFLELNVPHISTYSLIIEKNTMLSVKGEEYIDEDLDYEMYNLIIKKLSSYSHYEVSNFAVSSFESRHNLTYWNNLEYYGFGLSASGYLNGVRYTNTRNIKEYFDFKFVSESNSLSDSEILENEFILGFRKINGISKKSFFDKYGFSITDDERVKKLIKEGKLIENFDFVRISDDFIYLSNEILVDFLVDHE